MYEKWCRRFMRFIRSLKESHDECVIYATYHFQTNCCALTLSHTRTQAQTEADGWFVIRENSEDKWSVGWRIHSMIFWCTLSFLDRFVGSAVRLIVLCAIKAFTKTVSSKSSILMFEYMRYIIKLKSTMWRVSNQTTSTAEAAIFPRKIHRCRLRRDTPTTAGTRDFVCSTLNN